MLLKSFTSESQPVIETAAQSPAQQNRIVVKDGSKIKIIPVNQIHYLEAADDYVKIVTAEGSFLKKRTMSFFEQSLEQVSFCTHSPLLYCKYTTYYPY